jgi:hypothetical protein
MTKKRRAFVVSRSVIFLWMLLGLGMLGILLSGQITAVAATSYVHTNIAAAPTEAIMTQPLPPAVEKGANWPIVCGAIVLLVIIIGGVAWNFRIRKSNQADH